MNFQPTAPQGSPKQAAMGIRKEVILLFIIALAVLTGLAILIYSNTLQKEEDDQWVTHTHEVIESLSSLQSHIKDAETGQRGYLITGKSTFLLPYHSARVNTRDDLKTLQHLTQDNPLQQSRIQTLARLIKTRLAFLDNALLLQRQAGEDAARKLIMTDKGRNLMQQIRVLTADIEQDERNLLQERKQQVQKASEQIRLTLLLGLLTILGLIGGGLYLINKEMLERYRVQNKLSELNQNLETMVTQRTADLELARQKSETLAAERETILNQLVEGVIVSDPAGNIIFINDSAAYLHGVAKTGVPIEQYSDYYRLFTEEGLPYPTQELPLTRAVLNDEVITDERWRIRRGDGAEVLAIGSARPVYNQERAKIGAVLTIRDDTARVAAERALRESEEQFRTMAESIPQLAWMTNADGGIFWYNQRWYDYTGTTFDEMEGWGWTAVHHPDHVERVLETFRQSVQTGQIWEETFPLKSKDGEYRWFLSRAVPVHDADGNITRWFGSNTDITEQIETHQALLASEEHIRSLNDELEQRVEQRTAQLVAINRELESFSYSVSHDLRAPLRSIDGFSQALAEDYGDLLDEIGKDYLQRVRKESQRMGQLIDDMLNLSRLTRGELQKETVNLSQIAREITDALQAQNPERTSVNIDIQPGLLAQADERLIRAVLENLLGNAWKFTSHHSSAHIQFGSFYAEEDERPVFFVKDDGAGFNMAYVDKLFGAFQRLHAMTEFSGSGIGLATVQRIIHRHGGKVWAEGALEEGAVFYFTL